MLIQITKTMRQKLNLILTLFLAFVVQVSFAQEKTVTGTVTNAKGMPLIGVNVVVQGTTRGALTDFDGNYSISVSQGEVLKFSYLGYAAVTKTVGAQTTVDVTMKPDAAQLEQVVIVGYGTTTKQSFTGTAAVVDGEELAQKNASSVSQALQGEVAGVRIINSSGQPGSEPSVRIRGFGSVNGNRDPLYVVDGVPFNGNISAINPADIESTVVLKDATATAVYGSRGANGVIIIETKDGVVNESYIDISMKVGQNFRALPQYNTIESPEKFIGLAWESVYNHGKYKTKGTPVTDYVKYANDNLFSGISVDPKYNMWNVTKASDLIDPVTGEVRPGVTRKYTPENWADYAFEPSKRTEANIRIGGGNEKTTYFGSFGYLKDNGYSINSDFERFSTRLSVTHEVKEWLSGSINMGYTLSETNNNGQAEDSGSVFWFTRNMPSIYPVFLRDAQGNRIPDPIYGGFQYDYGSGRGFGAMTNAIAGANYNIKNHLKHEINLSNTFKAQITDGLTLETRFGLQYYNDNYNNLANKYYGSAAPQGGSLMKQKEQVFSYSFLQLLRYKFDIGKHNFEAFVAHESNSWEQNWLAAYKSKLVVPGGVELNNGVESSPASSYTYDYALESYFGQLKYNYDNKYFFSGTVRRDGSSRFSEGNKWGTFGAVGGAWVVSSEDFMNNADWISNLKLKASYGVTGEQAGVGYYPFVSTSYEIGNLNGNLSAWISTIGNPELTWETSYMTQVGVEFGIKDFLDGSVDYYLKDTKNQLFDRAVPTSFGYAVMTVNDGVLRNSGLEVNLTAHLVDQEDFFVDLNINGAFMANKLTKMPIDPSTGKEKLLDPYGIYGRAKGHSIYDFYMREYAGVNPKTGVSQWNVYYDDANKNQTLDNGEAISSLTPYLSKNPNANVETGKTEVYSEATRKFIGKSAIPDVRGAFTLNAGYKGFTLSVQMLYSIGGYGYDAVYANMMHSGTAGGNAWHKDILNRWQKPGDITNVPRLSAGLDQNVTSVSDRFLIKTNYLSLNNVRLGYTVPQKLTETLGLSKLGIFVTGSNLALFNKRDGYNPMTSQSGQASTYTYSPLSSVTAGVNISF